MPEYFVTWGIELSAADPLAAAQEALAIHREQDSLATVFAVCETGDEGRHFRVDLTRGTVAVVTAAGEHRLPEPAEGGGMMTNEVRFRCTNGQVHGLWFDEFERLYRELGIAAVRRASQIEWNPETAKWEVHLAEGQFIGAFDRRDQAIAREITFLQGRLEAVTG